MALSIQLSATVNDLKAAGILLKDTTGAYQVTTNPTGYGVENSFLAPSSDAFLRYKTWADTTWSVLRISSAGITQILSSDGYLLSAATLGLTGNVFSDGVNQIQYAPQNDAGVTATFTNGSKVVTLTTTAFDPNDYGSTLAAFISGFELETIHEVDWASTNDDTQMTLVEAYSGATTTVQLFFGPIKDLKVLVNKGAEACIAQTLASSSVIDCGCYNTFPQVNKMIQWRFIADILYECADYTGAHNTLVQVNKLCNSNYSSCAI